MMASVLGRADAGREPLRINVNSSGGRWRSAVVDQSPTPMYTAECTGSEADQSDTLITARVEDTSGEPTANLNYGSVP